MLININKKLDINALKDILNKSDLDNIQYIVMNEHTLHTLEAEIEISYAHISNLFNRQVKEAGQYFRTIYGIPVAVCNRLKFGEVDIV